jgi:hypothetical protein
VLLARDELSGWFGSFDRYAKAGKTGADSAHWLSMHNGESVTVDRASVAAHPLPPNYSQGQGAAMHGKSLQLAANRGIVDSSASP